MIEILSYPFMQRALIAALLTGLIAPASRQASSSPAFPV
jgi:ABC-type Mn2+/Zn2+ transport system permease subunit